MMSVLEYANDVNLSVEEVLKMCLDLGIKVENEDDCINNLYFFEYENGLEITLGIW